MGHSMLAVVNKASNVSNEEATLMTLACNKQLSEHVAPAWGIEAWPVVFYPDVNQVPAEAFQIALLDHADAPSVAGYHEMMNGKPYGRVFTSQPIDGGGGALYNPYNPAKMTVSSVLSHEVIEARIDPSVNLWCDGPTIEDGSAYALEVCDPVEKDYYAIDINGTKVSVANFVFQSWFNQETPAGTKVDYLGTAPGPFKMAPGGYMIIRKAPGSEKQFAHPAAVDDGHHLTKRHVMARTARRLRNITNMPRRKK